MRFRLLAALPLLWGALFLAGDAALSGGPAYPLFLRVEIELVKAMALAGSLAAALAFGRGDYQRRAWLFIAGCMALLLLRDLTLAPIGLERYDERTLAVARGVLVALANVSQVIGTWILARAWKVGHLALPGSRAAQLGLGGAAVVLSALVAGPSVVESAGRVGQGDAAALTGLVSALGDAVSLCLIAPLLLTALALRGGVFGWTWGLLTTSYLAWLLYDGFAVVAGGLGLEAHAARTGSELFRALGCMYGFSAGMAQRAVVEGLRHLPAPAGESRLAGAA